MASDAPRSSNELLSIRGLHVDFDTDAGGVPAVRGVDLDVGIGETVALVGESGCGKSVTALSIMRLITGRISGGSIRFQGQELEALPEAEMRRVRGAQVGMIFQEPMTSLNPVFTIGRQIEEVLILHQKLAPRAARAQALELLERVGIPSPERRIAQYPHELSGGMKQRVMIAMAIACRPKLLIADEPTTALDVTIQAQIMELLRSLKKEFGMAVLLITHDLGVVAHFAERVAVMYAGKIVEEGQVRDIFKRAAHPYTQALLAALPDPLNPSKRLEAIPGRVPSARMLPPGCAFCARCKLAFEPCPTVLPPLFEIAPGHAHRAACLLHDPSRAPARHGTGS
ncbi:MAG TPA: ABC transporter ATP-binding protein [Polyangiaceae bacterium]|jgi:oligopeptide/dipeptide ABC transporter ATP-binding protein|nr:ABC transporter ATP-binding protein [Polyangiaceae bacterium]